MIVRTAVTSAPLSVAEHESAVADPAAGAVVSFAGVVRDHDEGRGVVRLVYEGHPSAASVGCRWSTGPCMVPPVVQTRSASSITAVSASM